MSRDVWLRSLSETVVFVLLKVVPPLAGSVLGTAIIALVLQLQPLRLLHAFSMSFFFELKDFFVIQYWICFCLDVSPGYSLFSRPVLGSWENELYSEPFSLLCLFEFLPPLSFVFVLFCFCFCFAFLLTPPLPLLMLRWKSGCVVMVSFWARC